MAGIWFFSPLVCVYYVLCLSLCGGASNVKRCNKHKSHQPDCVVIKEPESECKSCMLYIQQKSIQCLFLYSICTAYKLQNTWLVREYFGGPVKAPVVFLYCLLIYFYCLYYYLFCTEVYGRSYNLMVKSCEIWHTGKKKKWHKEAMAQVWHQLAKGWCYSKQLKMQIWTGISHVPFDRVMKLFHMDLQAPPITFSTNYTSLKNA